MSDSSPQPEGRHPPAQPAFDWKMAKQRLARLQQAVVQSHEMSSEQARAVMDQRARALARVPEYDADTSEIQELVTFSLAKERVALETRYVREVFHLDDVTPLPDSPDFLLGVTNLRGEVLAIMDLRAFLGIPAGEEDGSPQVLILGTDRAEFGVLADDVQEVVTLHIGDVREPPSSVAGVGREYLSGVTEDAMLVLDGSVLLSDPRLVIDQSD
jgi:purine-binding chemotaxis protein CheW